MAKLSDPKNETPIFGESVAFDRLAPEHRKSFIHSWEARLEGNDELPVRGNWLQKALESDYEFDRIGAYLFQEKRSPADFGASLEPVRRELERCGIKPEGSYMPLHYALRALRTARALGSRRKEIEGELDRIGEFLLKVGKLDNDPLFSAIERVRVALSSAGTVPRILSRKL